MEIIALVREKSQHSIIAIVIIIALYHYSLEIKVILYTRKRKKLSLCGDTTLMMAINTSTILNIMYTQYAGASV